MTKREKEAAALAALALLWMWSRGSSASTDDRPRVNPDAVSARLGDEWKALLDRVYGGPEWFRDAGGFIFPDKYPTDMTWVEGWRAGLFVPADPDDQLWAQAIADGRGAAYAEELAKGKL